MSTQSADVHQALPESQVWGNGRIWHLPTCPFNPPDNPHPEDGKAYIVIRQDGTIGASCHHARCQKRIHESGSSGWALLKELGGYMPHGSESSTDGNATDGLPKIQSNHRQIREITADALAAINLHENTHSSEPLIYVRDAALVRIVAGETCRDEQGRPLNDSRKLVVTTSNELAYILARVADWRQLNKTKKGDKYIDVPVPKSVINDLLGAAQWPTLPPLVGLSYCPTFAPDGTLHHEPGYNRNSGLYHANAVPLGDTTPSPENVKQALALLDEMLHDFPFVDDASRAHTFALILLPFVRDLISGPTPLYAIDAPTPGTGKGLLAECGCYISRGHELASAPAPQEDAEWAKAITSWLLEGRTHVAIDNINAPLESASLALALTQSRWGNRVLGVNRTVDLPVRQVWIATGNNLSFSSEIARRVLLIRLDANVEKPDQRTEFRHADLRQWVREKRPALVTACCVLIRNWFAQGKPEFVKRTRGSYEAWCRIMGGILEANGIEGFLANTEEVRVTAATEIDTLRNFVAAWAEKWGTNLVSANNLLTVASYCDKPDGSDGWIGMDLLSDVCTATKEAGRRIQMGKYISEHCGKVVSVEVKGESRTYKIDPPDHNRKGVLYRLKQLP